MEYTQVSGSGGVFSILPSWEICDIVLSIWKQIAVINAKI